MKFFTFINTFVGNDTFEIVAEDHETAMQLALDSLGWMVSEESFEDSCDRFPVGTIVNVEPSDSNEEFTGRVVGFKKPFVQVQDEDGDVYDIELDQLSYNSDEEMHS